MTHRLAPSNFFNLCCSPFVAHVCNLERHEPTDMVPPLFWLPWFIRLGSTVRPDQPIHQDLWEVYLAFVSKSLNLAPARASRKLIICSVPPRCGVGEIVQTQPPHVYAVPVRAVQRLLNGLASKSLNSQKGTARHGS